MVMGTISIDGWIYMCFVILVPSLFDDLTISVILYTVTEDDQLTVTENFLHLDVIIDTVNACGSLRLFKDEA